jgi:AbrB family looped-hinge helix DNA binding protein
MEVDMTIVRVSPKFQVVIPKEVRETLGLRAGERLGVFLIDDRIELVPTRPIRSARGLIRGISTAVARDEDRT